MQVVGGADRVIGQWVAERIPHVAHVDALGKFAALAVVDDAGEIVAGCVYHNYVPAYGVCDITFAADTPRWATRQNIATMLGVPFLQYGCQRVTCVTPAANKAAIRFLTGLGFVKEGAHVGAFGHGQTALSFRLLRHNYNQLMKRYGHGQERG